MADTLEPFQKPVRSQDRYLLAGLAILIVTLGGYVGWQHRTTAEIAGAPASAPSPAIRVSMATAERRDVPIYLTGLGTVQAFNTVTIKTRVDGELVKVAFTEARTSGRAISWRRSIRDRFRPHTIKRSQKRVQDGANIANAKLDVAANSTAAKG